MTVDELAQEIRRVDGEHKLGAGALAEALMPFLANRDAPATGGGEPVGAAEREVGRAVYERIERLMGGEQPCPELAYLADLTASVEEYGSYSGPVQPLYASPLDDRMGEDGWTQWNGGENPIPGVDPFEARRRDGRVVTLRERYARWDHAGDPSDIMAYCTKEGGAS